MARKFKRFAAAALAALMLVCSFGFSQFASYNGGASSNTEAWNGGYRRYSTAWVCDNDVPVCVYAAVYVYGNDNERYDWDYHSTTDFLIISMIAVADGQVLDTNEKALACNHLEYVRSGDEPYSF